MTYVTVDYSAKEMTRFVENLYGFDELLPWESQTEEDFAAFVEICRCFELLDKCTPGMAFILSQHLLLSDMLH